MPALTKIQIRRDTATNWSTTNPTLAAGELGFDTTNNLLKIGNGSSTWTALGIAASSSVIGCKLEKGVAQSLTSGTVTAILFGTSDTEIFDTNSFHDPSTNSSRITIPSGFAGKYLITATIGIAASATGNRYCAIYKNGVLDASTRAPANAAALSATLLTASTVLSLTATDYVEMYGFQDSGGALNALAGTYTSLSAVYLGA
jgi:hypothetical protein